MNSDIYRDMIMEHYKNPVNAGVVENVDVAAKDYNPICGDIVEIQIKFNDGKIDKIKFQGQGCAISQSSVDILIEMVKNKDVEEVKNLTPEDFMENLGIGLSPLRLKCALLGFKTLKTAVYSYLESKLK